MGKIRITETSLMGETLETKEEIRLCVDKVVPSRWGATYPPSYEVIGCQPKAEFLAILNCLKEQVAKSPESSHFGFNMIFGEIPRIVEAKQIEKANKK